MRGVDPKPPATNDRYMDPFSPDEYREVEFDKDCERRKPYGTLLRMEAG
jgi:hypothetical protein